MTRRFIVFSVLFLSAVCLFAGSIVGVGYGQTETAAREDACKALSEQILTNVYFSSTASLSTKTVNGKNSTEEYFASLVDSSSDNVLLGVEYGFLKKEKSGYSITAQITTKATTAYRSQITTILKTIEANDKSFSAILESDDFVDQERIVEEQLMLFHKLDSCKAVLNLLTNGQDTTSITVASGIRSKILYESMYDSILAAAYEEEMNQMTMRSLEAAAFSDTSSDIKHELERTQQAIAVLSEKMDVRNAQKALDRERLLKDISSKNRSLADSYYNKANTGSRYISQNLMNENQIVKEIEEMRQEYKSVQADLNQLYQDIEDEAARIYDTRAIELKNHPYKQADYERNKKGEYVVSDKAKEIRQEELNEILAEKNSYIEKMKSSMAVSVNPQSQQLDTLLNLKISSLNSKTFVTSARDGRINCTVDSFDAARMGWPVSFTIPILGKTIAFETTILLSSVTGKQYLKPSAMNKSQYKSFQDDVEVYQAFLSNGFDVLDCQISYAINTSNVAESQYVITLKGMTMKRLDTGVIILQKTEQDFSKIKVVKNYILELETAAETTGENSYRVGDTGPAGGLIFYVNNDADADWKYLEAAPSDLASKSRFGSSSSQTLALLEGLGEGKENTELLVKKFGRSGAASLCDQYVLNGYSDWYLPSVKELQMMWQNLYSQSKGGFHSGYYWSSTESSTSKAYLVFFNSKGTTAKNDKSLEYYVRPIRAF